MDYNDMQMRLAEYNEERKMDIQTHYEKKNLDLGKEAAKLSMLEDFAERRSMKHLTVVRDAASHYFYGYADSEGRIRNSAPVCRGEFPDFQIFFSVYPSRKEALHVRIPRRSDAIVFSDFNRDAESNGAKVFRRLRQYGFELKCAESIWREVAEKLMADLLETIIPVEIPGVWGWNKRQDGTWIFASGDVMTMEELR